MKNFLVSLLFCFSITALFIPCDLSATGDNDQADNAVKNQDTSPRNCDQSKIMPSLAIDTRVKPILPRTNQLSSYPVTPTSPSNPLYRPALCCAAHRAVRNTH